MQLQVSVVLISILFLIAPSSWAHDENHHKGVIEHDARLRWEAQIAQYLGGVDYGSSRPSQLPAGFVQSIAQTVEGDGVLVVFHRPECYRYSDGSFRPSHCGDSQRVLIALKALPAVGEVLSMKSPEFVTAVMSSGYTERTVGGCIGYPDDMRIERLPEKNGNVVLEISAQFHQFLSKRYPAPCGVKTFEGTFELM